MGSCVSLQRSSESAIKLKLVIPPSPIKDNKSINDVALKSKTSPPPIAAAFVDCGSKEEAFFDSRPYLDSDCESDFYSVNGDFTPSTGNTPVHHSFSVGGLEGLNPSGTPEPSPTARKKKLADLFRESFRYHQSVGDQNDVENLSMNGGNMDAKTTVGLNPKSIHGTAYLSGTNSLCGSERTSNGDSLIEDEKSKSIRSSQRCLPNLMSCHSFSGRKKKSQNTSPAMAGE